MLLSKFAYDSMLYLVYENALYYIQLPYLVLFSKSIINTDSISETINPTTKC